LRLFLRLAKLAVLHFDAHTDLMESRYGVPHCFATWAAHAVKRLLPHQRKNFIQVGLRVSAKSQAHWESKFGIKQYWMGQLRGVSAKAFAIKLVEQWIQNGCDSVYVSFDVDALDPKHVSSTGTPEEKGLDLAWSVQVITEVSRHLPIVAADLVELAPVLGSESSAKRSTKSAARIAQALLLAMRSGLNRKKGK
jgi:agmatinase